MTPLESALTGLSRDSRAINNLVDQAILEGEELMKSAEHWRQEAEKSCDQGWQATSLSFANMYASVAAAKFAKATALRTRGRRSV